MKTAIVYYSKHHKNTKKVLDAIASQNEVALFDASQTEQMDLTSYDTIGFASGIYYSRFHKSVLNVIKNHLPEGKRVFFLYTCGAKKASYAKSAEALAAEKHAQLLGSFSCLGFDTYGPFQLVGGLAKGHPDQDDLSSALTFYASLNR